MVARLLLFTLFLVGATSTDIVGQHRKLPVCGLLENLLGSLGQIDCTCSEGNVFMDFLRGEKVHFDCAMTDVCLLNDNFCGAANYGASIQRNNGIAVTLDACVEFFDLEQSIIDLGIPGVEFLLNLLDPTLPEVLCVEALREAETGVECAASINNEPCERCEVCESGLTVSVDCSNIYPFLNFDCIGIQPPDVEPTSSPTDLPTAGPTVAPTTAPVAVSSMSPVAVSIDVPSQLPSTMPLAA